mmetsp:Transcript_623/g.1902  ORF Transcript_623/g.1902 Transcript_623/m.1902 type:complete len:258 (+) Transcript_623:1627-2400(+)
MLEHVHGGRLVIPQRVQLPFDIRCNVSSADHSFQKLARARTWSWSSSSRGDLKSGSSGCLRSSTTSSFANSSLGPRGGGTTLYDIDLLVTTTAVHLSHVQRRDRARLGSSHSGSLRDGPGGCGLAACALESPLCTLSFAVFAALAWRNRHRDVRLGFDRRFGARRNRHRDRGLRLKGRSSSLLPLLGLLRSRLLLGLLRRRPLLLGERSSSGSGSLAQVLLLHLGLVLDQPLFGYGGGRNGRSLALGLLLGGGSHTR